MTKLSFLTRKLSSAFALACVLVACASAPIQEMSDARQALQAAREVGASQHAPRYLRQAESYLQQAETSLSEGNIGFKPARENAVSAKQSAITGRTVALAIAAAKNAVAEAVAAGKLSDATQTALREAVAAANQGDDARAIALANQSQALAEQDLTR